MVDHRSIGTDAMGMWGIASRELGLSAGVTYEDLSKHLGYSKSLIVGVERGIRMPSNNYIYKADEKLKANGLLIAMAEHLSRKKHPTWSAEYAEEEKGAVALSTYVTNIFHSLTQTENYMRALLATRCPVLDKEEIDVRVQARLERQEVLNQSKPPLISFIVEEAILHRCWGGSSVMGSQLEFLLGLSHQRNVSIQIMPSSTLHAGHEGGMTLLETQQHRRLGYTEAQGNSHLIHEPEIVSTLHQRYSIMRSQALSLDESRDLMKRRIAEM